MQNNGLLTFLAGALAGAGLVWLLTSDEGQEFVDKLKKEAGDVKDSLGREWEELKKQAAQAQQGSGSL